MRTVSVWSAACCALLVMACRPAAEAPSQADTTDLSQTTGPADSLVLTLPSGHAVWLAEGRPARDSAGTACFERSVEIRTGTSTVKVPLLFVMTAPAVLDRANLRAELSRHCRVMAVYRVELATGRPYKLEDR